jgi:hypothetical protein
MLDYEVNDDRNDNRNDDRRGDNDPIHTEKIVTDRKIFFLDLRENDRGRFIKITEDVRGRRDTIMVPCEVLDDLIESLQEIASIDRDAD